MVDRKQVNVDRLSPAFFWRTSPTCSVLNRGQRPGKEQKCVRRWNRDIFKDCRLFHLPFSDLKGALIQSIQNENKITFRKAISCWAATPQTQVTPQHYVRVLHHHVLFYWFQNMVWIWLKFDLVLLKHRWEWQILHFSHSVQANKQ